MIPQVDPEEEISPEIKIEDPSNQQVEAKDSEKVEQEEPPVEEEQPAQAQEQEAKPEESNDQQD